jgi:hypothetical protein
MYMLRYVNYLKIMFLEKCVEYKMCVLFSSTARQYSANYVLDNTEMCIGLQLRWFAKIVSSY